MNDTNEEEKKQKVDGKKLLEAVKKLAALGIGAIFMTEDAIKNTIQDIPLPKEILGGLLEQIRSNKNEFINSLKTDFKGYLSSINPSKEIEKIIEKYDINIQAKLSFKRKSTENDLKEESSEHQ